MTFRCYIDRHEEAGLEVQIDRRRVEEVSHRKAPVDEVLLLRPLYKRRCESWNMVQRHVLGAGAGVPCQVCILTNGWLQF